MSRTALFSKIIFRICLVRVSSSSISLPMDRYLPIPKQKNEHEITKLGRAVCVLGKTGIGKTWLIHHTFERYLELTADILRSKQTTSEFLIKIQNSPLPVVLDEYESVYDLIGLREIKEPPSLGQFVIISQIPVKFDFEMNVYNVPIKTPSEIKKLFPKADQKVIETCEGDIRIVKQSLEFKSDIRDKFQTPRDFLNSLVSKKTNVNPAQYIGYPIQEPGNISSILHENYVDGKGNLAEISSMFSVADIIETKVYDGSWEYLHYFNVWGCIMPAVELKHSLGTKLRPGSTWTKFQNMCMREKRLEVLSKRTPGKRLSFEEMLLLREYAEHENGEILREYNLEPQDIDVLNHLSPLRKIKAKTVASLKKCLTSQT